MTYLEKQAAIQQALFDAGISVGYQRCIDELALAINDLEGYGAKRTEELFLKMQEYGEMFRLAYTNDKEADYYQAKLDERLEKIFHEKFQPFKARYPDIKQQRYGKRKK